MNAFPLLLLAFGTAALSLLSSLVDTGEQEVVAVSVRHNSGEASVATSFVLLETFGVGGVELNLARLCPSVNKAGPTPSEDGVVSHIMSSSKYKPLSLLLEGCGQPSPVSSSVNMLENDSSCTMLSSD